MTAYDYYVDHVYDYAAKPDGAYDAPHGARIVVEHDIDGNAIVTLLDSHGYRMAITRVPAAVLNNNNSSKENNHENHH